jgi:hypothetical protein
MKALASSGKRDKTALAARIDAPSTCCAAKKLAEPPQERGPNTPQQRQRRENTRKDPPAPYLSSPRPRLAPR